jgi:DNA-binding NarL/FixJ family response regulator
VALVRVAAVNDYEIIVHGLAALLSRFPDRLVVCDAIVIGEPLRVPVDVALYDTYGRERLAVSALRELTATRGVGAVAIFSLDLIPTLVEEAREAGARGFISKAVAADEIADAIVRIARGEEVLVATPTPRPALPQLDWPAKESGLTERESQVLVLLGEGLSNREIGAALYLSTETVKGYVATVFAKLKVRNRVEAALFVRDSGAFTKYQPVRGGITAPREEPAAR